MKYFLPDLYVGRILDVKMMFVIMLMVLFSMTLMMMLAMLFLSVCSNQLLKMLMVVDIIKLNNTVNLITIILAGAVGEYWL